MNTFGTIALTEQIGRADEPWAHSPGDLLARIRWAPGSPPKVREAACEGDFGVFWPEWSAELPARRRWPNAERGRGESLVLLSAYSLAEVAATAGRKTQGGCRGVPPDSLHDSRQSTPLASPACAWRKVAKRLFAAACRSSGGNRRAVAEQRRLARLARQFERLSAAEVPERPCTSEWERIDAQLRGLFALELLVRFGRDLPVDTAAHIWKTALVATVCRDAGLGRSGGEGREDTGSGVRTPYGLPVGPDVAPAWPAFASLERLLSGELQYTAGLVFADVSGAAALRRAGARLVASELLDRTDTDGTPSADLWPLMASWVASLYRTTLAARLFGSPFLTPTAEDRLRDVLVCVAGSVRRDGGIALCDEPRRWIGGLLANAAALVDLPSRHPARAALRALARSVGESLRGTVRGAGGDSGKSRDNGHAARAVSGAPGAPRVATAYHRTVLPSHDSVPLVQSDWARFGRMRSEWSANGDVLAVAYSDGQTRLELAPRGRPVLQGEWTAHLSVGDVSVEPAGWECVCSHADEDCEYLELHTETSSGIRWDRQILLSRTDGFAMLAEAVVGPPEALLQLRASLPAAGGTVLEPSEDGPAVAARQGRSRPILVTAPETRLPESPAVIGRPSPLKVEEGARTISYCVADRSGGLFWPLVVCWSGPRAQPQWRALTVAESRRRVPPSVAGAFRLRLGKLHLLIYRSLRRPTTARTFLGCHTDKETYVAHIRPRGRLEPILLVDG